jgi:hypothetical protein
MREGAEVTLESEGERNNAVGIKFHSMSESLFGCRAGPPADALRAMAWLAEASRRRRLVDAGFHERSGAALDSSSPLWNLSPQLNS